METTIDYKTKKISDVTIGDILPSLEIPITSSLIVGGAIASRDFTDVHHDVQAARQSGLPDIFMNILTSNGLMGRFVTDWSGPDSRIKEIDIQLGAPNLPGFVMTITGNIIAIDLKNRTVEINVVGENNVWGIHMTGSVCVELPDENTQQGD